MKRLWLVWGAVAVIVAGLSWMLASLYFLRWIDARPIAFGALASSNPTQPLPPEYPVEKAFFTVTFFYNEQPQ